MTTVGQFIGVLECTREALRALPLWIFWLLPFLLTQIHANGIALLNRTCYDHCHSPNILATLFLSAGAISWPLYRWQFVPLPILLLFLIHLVYTIQSTMCFVFLRWTSVLGVYVALSDIILIGYVLLMAFPYVQHTCLLRMCLWKAQAVVVPCCLVPQFLIVFLTM